MDLELKKAFAELQRKVQSTSQKLQIKDLQINQMKRAKRENENTSKEVSKLPSNTVVYESVGRSFILSNFNQMKANLETENKTLDDKINNLENDKEVLTRSIKQSKENLRELVQQKKNQI